jgi:predicted aspartyl protease
MCWIKVHGSPGFGTADYLGVLDTGADLLILPIDVARTLKIDLANCPVEYLTVASGEILEVPMKDVEVTILGRRISVTAMFGHFGEVLIGLHTITKAMKFGVDYRGWLYRRRRKTYLS